MATIMNFTDFENFRYNAFTGEYNPKLIGYAGNPAEVRVIPNTAPYILTLYEKPQENIPSTTSISGFVEVPKTQAPASGQYRVNYDDRGIGQIQFNKAQAGQTVNIKYYGLGVIAQKQVLEDLMGGLSVKVVEIGSWDMDSVSQITVAHGLSDNTKIRAVQVVIQNDDQNVVYNLCQNANNADPFLYAGSWRQATGANISLIRRTAGVYTGANFDNAVINRGWIIIWHES